MPVAERVPVMKVQTLIDQFKLHECEEDAKLSAGVHGPEATPTGLIERFRGRDHVRFINDKRTIHMVCDDRTALVEFHLD